MFAAVLLVTSAPLAANEIGNTADFVTITRDDWGIAHIKGKTDAAAVFGMIYAQAEDDFPRIEANYLTALGRTAEAEGEDAIWRDLRSRLYVSDAKLKALYARSPLQMQGLMRAWADGLNYYLAKHPEVKPKVLTRFEPWMALAFTEGSIGGDIERIDEKGLAAWYGQKKLVLAEPEDREPRGSNGIAIAPALTKDGHALLLINPHTSFYFRAEQQVQSDEGLDVYGASTWGQFFVYQGWNRHAGWMHTSSGVDNVDEFSYDIRKVGARWQYRFGKAWRPLAERPVTIRYRRSDGSMGSRSFTVFDTHRGPVIRGGEGKVVAFAMMDRPVEALQQSFLRTKAKDLASFRAVTDRFRANSSNNTVFASTKGEIALLAPQFMPRRSARFAYTSTVDGSNPASDWQGFHAPSELPNTVNPASGWVYNSNDWLYSASGGEGEGAARYPKYLDTAGANYRTVHAQRVLRQGRDWTPETLRAAAYGNAQPAFEMLVPMLVSAWAALPADDAARVRFAEPVSLLRGWDGRWSVDSEANTLGQFWADEMARAIRASAWDDDATFVQRLERLPGAEKLAALDRAIARLERDWGSWRVKWGEVNRYQRIDSAIDPKFDDKGPSLPVGFASNRWGSLASFGSRPRQSASGEATKRWYGDNGNSFVAVVEFGPQVRARAVSAGGESGDPASPHFTDQAARYANGDLREVYLTAEQLKAHTVRTYRPGE